jgi:hypothetical protein
MRVLPFAYRNVVVPEGTCLRVTVQGECGSSWWLVRESIAWTLLMSPQGRREAAAVQVPQEIAWQIFTKGISRNRAEAMSVIDGDKRLADHFFTALAIVG